MAVVVSFTVNIRDLLSYTLKLMFFYVNLLLSCMGLPKTTSFSHVLKVPVSRYTNFNLYNDNFDRIRRLPYDLKL